MQNFRNLDVWGNAHGLTLDVYRITEHFPRTEMFGLTSQLRRASASIAANLAEGCGRTQLEFARFIQISLGSASEVEYHLLLAHDLGFIAIEDYQHLTVTAVEVKCMLNALLKRIQSAAARTRTGGSSRSQLPKQLTEHDLADS